MKNSKILLKFISITLSSATLFNGSFASAAPDGQSKKTSITPWGLASGIGGVFAVAGLTGGLVYKSIDAKKKSGKLEELEAQRKKLENQRKSLEDELKKAESKKSNATEKLDKQCVDLEAEKAEKEEVDECAKLKKQCSDLETRRKDLEARLKTAEKGKTDECATLQKQYDDLKTKLKKVEKEKTDECDKLQKQCDDLESKLKKAEKEKADECAKLQKQCDDLETRRKDLEARPKGADTKKLIQPKVPQESKKNSELDVRCKKLDTELQQLHAVCRRLRSQCNDYEVLLDKLQKEKPEIQELLKKQRTEFEQSIQQFIDNLNPSYTQGMIPPSTIKTKSYIYPSMPLSKIYIFAAISSDFIDLAKYPSKSAEDSFKKLKEYIPENKFNATGVYFILKFLYCGYCEDEGIADLLRREVFQKQPIGKEKHGSFLHCLAHTLKELDNIYSNKDPMNKFPLFLSCELRQLMRLSELEKYLDPKSS